MTSYADALSAKGYRSFGFDTDMEMDMDMGCTMRRIEKRKGGTQEHKNARAQSPKPNSILIVQSNDFNLI
ncbi:hypothetical protein M5D96_014216 [Drosophila gunungcola]|uniref:Uncharacterized protein n=1 Tax=Drosophila gunungcola TaxID=103775 RepID=A0A9P9YAM1_9MUSC|nr:hypothetical protein M5D96_014216 [Drosophila gunungcola]